MHRTYFIAMICAMLSACGTSPGKDDASGAPRSSSPSKFTYTRIYCTPDTETHFENVTVDLAKIAAAPPAPPMYIITGGLPQRAPTSLYSSRAGAPKTWRRAHIIPHRVLNSRRYWRGGCRLPRQTARRGAFA